MSTQLTGMEGVALSAGVLSGAIAVFFLTAARHRPTWGLGWLAA